MMTLSATGNMWASCPTPATPLPWVSRPVVFAGNRIRLERCFTLALSHKFQRRRGPPPRQNDGRDRHVSDSLRDIGGFGRTVLCAIKSNSHAGNSTSSMKSSNSQQLRQQRQSNDQEERQISGSDVLLALQRAAARKIKKKRRDSSAPKAPANRGRSDSEDEEDTFDYSSARSICIKSDWFTRLDELEKRLQYLMDIAT